MGRLSGRPTTAAHYWQVVGSSPPYRRLTPAYKHKIARSPKAVNRETRISFGANPKRSERPAVLPARYCKVTWTQPEEMMKVIVPGPVSPMVAVLPVPHGAEA